MGLHVSLLVHIAMYNPLHAIYVNRYAFMSLLCIFSQIYAFPPKSYKGLDDLVLFFLKGFVLNVSSSEHGSLILFLENWFKGLYVNLIILADT